MTSIQTSSMTVTIGTVPSTSTVTVPTVTTSTSTYYVSVFSQRSRHCNRRHEANLDLCYQSTLFIVSTTSATVSSGTSTAYNACQTNNMVSSYAPGDIFDAISDPVGFNYHQQVSSGLACCVLCQQSGPSCGGFSWTATNKACTFFKTSSDNSVCAGSVVAGHIQYTGNTTTPNGVSGNANCGQLAPGPYKAPTGSSSGPPTPGPT